MYLFIHLFSFIELFVHYFWQVGGTFANVIRFLHLFVNHTEKSGCSFCNFTSALNAPSPSAARAPRAHTDSARTVCLQNRQRRLLCRDDFREQEEEEEGAMVGTAERSVAVCQVPSV